LARSANPRARAAVRQRLEHWRQDADLAPVRDKAALKRLPRAERAEWHHLWDGANVLHQSTIRQN
jgi:hypothetical protein